MATNSKRKDTKGTAKVLKKKSGSKASSRPEEKVERAEDDSNSDQIYEEGEEEEEEGGGGGRGGERGGGGGEREGGRGGGGEGGGEGGKGRGRGGGGEGRGVGGEGGGGRGGERGGGGIGGRGGGRGGGGGGEGGRGGGEGGRGGERGGGGRGGGGRGGGGGGGGGEVEAGHGFWSIIVYSTILIAVVLGVILAPVVIPEELKAYIVSERYEENAKFNYVKIFDDKLKEMKTHFPNQTTRFWKILKTRGLGHLNDKQPKQPLVILMGAPPSAHSIIDCLAWKLAKALDPGNYDLGHIDGSRFSSYGGHEAKKIMDKKLEKLFQKGDRSALILHLELLPPPSPILFYSYCDNDNAPFKHAGIIFTVHLPEEPNLSLSPVEQEGMIEKYLSDVAWSKYPYEQDSVSALLSRIADTVALVSGETEEVVQSHCS